jgi:hypothetical protein
LNELEKLGHEVLQHIPSKPGLCGVMSALYVANWERKSPLPIYMVAGELYVNETRVFGHDLMSQTINEEINKSNPSWDGHFWVVFGSHIIDVSIFRTAYSDYSPAALATHVKEVFGLGKELLITSYLDLVEKGFKYIPHAVLTYEQVTAYCHGAKALLQG